MHKPIPKISMNQGAAYWSRITGAPRPHRSTLIRWAIKGVRGKRLQAEPLAGRWFIGAGSTRLCRRWDRASIYPGMVASNDDRGGAVIDLDFLPVLGREIPCAA